MGIWEDTLEVIKDRKDVVAELRQVRRGGGKYIVFELCNLTGKHAAKKVVSEDEFLPEHTKTIVKSVLDMLEKEELERKEELLNTIEKALGIELKKWQRQYALMTSDWRPEDVRGCGKTLASHLRVLINARELFPGLRSESIYISRGTLRLWPTDENAGMARAEHNVTELAELSRTLREKGVDVPEIVYNPHDYRERVKRCQQGGASWTR